MAEIQITYTVQLSRKEHAVVVAHSINPGQAAKDAKTAIDQLRKKRR